MSSCNLILTGAAMADCALPGDIMIEILSWLPVKSLMRFRCVCKPWCSLTTNPSFITKHLTHNTNENLIIHSGGHKKSRYLISMLRHGKKKLDPPVNLKLPFAEVSSDVQILGSCNGLLCIYDVSGIFLWNPATREYRRLPVPGIWILKLSLDSICLEFGFDANANDYKLVRVLRCSSRGFDVPNLVYKAEVYSKKTNSWKEINADLQCRLIELSPAADFGGRVHWRAHRFNDHWTADGLKNSELIAYFDLGREVFGEIQLLDCLVSGFQRGRVLAVVKDLLAFVVYPYEEDLNRVIEVWVMKEYGVKESWTKQLSIGPFSIIGRPLAYFRNGKFLLWNKRGELFWYDSNSQEFDRLGVFITRYIYDVYTCVETLVSVKGGE